MIEDVTKFVFDVIHYGILIWSCEIRNVQASRVFMMVAGVREGARRMWEILACEGGSLSRSHKALVSQSSAV